MNGGLVGSKAKLEDAVNRKVVAGYNLEVVHEPLPKWIDDGMIPSGAFLRTGCSAGGLVGRLVPSFGHGTKVRP